MFSFTSIILNVIDENDIKEKLTSETEIEEDSETESEESMEEIPEPSNYTAWGEIPVQNKDKTEVTNRKR